MPFKSQAQRGFLFANHPDIARRWAREYPSQGKLPMRVSQGPRAQVATALMSRQPKVGY
jgi:hypothetical protein